MEKASSVNRWPCFRAESGLSDTFEEVEIPAPPPWRRFGHDRSETVRCWDRNQHLDLWEFERDKLRAKTLVLPEPKIVDIVNAAILLRRPLLVQGAPSTGKSSLAYSIAYQLGLKPVLHWAVTSAKTFKESLYGYDPVARLAATKEPGSTDSLEPFLVLGPVGTAFADSVPDSPRVLLIDELDKGDYDLADDLLNLFEEGYFEVPEISRYLKGTGKGETACPLNIKTVEGPEIPVGGRVVCREFPIVVITDNRSRQWSNAFLRRCLRVDMTLPADLDRRKVILHNILKNHFQGISQVAPERKEAILALVDAFLALTGEEPPLGGLVQAVKLELDDMSVSSMDHVLSALLQPYRDS